ncbi:uncharacterized protein LOC134011883 [Osmerus eperlanus]|uniref:uncharacterized protein LOC134011883 n=1 Tax=Osmerus eperlanus TaxID=29151 RepID=UPI002E129ED4
MEVKCKSPADLRGQLVWNVSRCVTPTAHPVSPTLLLVPLTSDKPVPQIPPSVTIPALIAIIVVLCVLLCVVCALAGVYGRRRRRKQVRPQPEIKEEEGEPQPLNPPRQPYQKCPEEMMNWDLECVRRVPGTEVRAKSANAVLSTSPFCGGGRRRHDMETETEGTSRKPTPTEENSSGEQGEELGEDSGNVTAQDTDEELKAQRRLTDFINEGTQYDDGDDGVSPSGNGSRTITKATEDTETITYLSIGTDLTTPKTGKPNGLHGESRGPRIQIGRAIGRVSTWPPTSSQWEARCANQGEGLSSFNVPEPFQDSVVKSDVLSEGGTIIVMEPVPNYMLSPEGYRGDTTVEERSGEPVEEPVEATVKEPAEESTEEPLEPDFETASLNYDPVSENLVISIPDATEPLTGSAKLQSEPANSAEFQSGSAELLSDRPYSTEPLIGSAELQSEPPNSTDLPSGSAELLSEPYSTEPLHGSSELQSEPPNSTELPSGSAELLSEPYSTKPLIGSAEFQSEPPYSTEPITPVADLQSEPPGSTEPPVEYRQSQLCLVSFETASTTEFDISPDGGSQSTIAPTEPKSEPITVSGPLSGKTPSQISKAEELQNVYEDTTGLTESGEKQKTTFETPTGKEPEIQVLGGSSQSPPSGGSPNDENLLANNEYVFVGLLQEVVQNRGRRTRERWRQTHKNQQLYRRKGQDLN